jgi:hippurate hydrolase
MLVAQPAEEAISGAKALMDSGLYEKLGTPDAAIGLHCYGPTTPDVIATRSGPMMAGNNAIDVTLHGRGGHASVPHDTVDPIVMLGTFIGEAHKVVSRNVRPGDEALITIGQVQAGTARNIIPNDAVAKLTVRSFDAKVQKTLLDGVTRAARGASISGNATKEPTITHARVPYPTLINDDVLTARLTTVWRQELAGEKISVREMPRIMGSEDFPRYAREDRSIPTTFFFVGVTPQEVLDKRKEQGLPPPIAHTDEFLPDAVAAMRTGMLALTTAATHFLMRKT